MVRFRFNRRAFTKSTAMALAASPALNVLGANEKVHVGLIGCSPRGEKDMRAFLRNGAEFTAVCDVDQQRLQRGRERAGGESVRAYHDFRRLLEQKDLDAVLIATPPHWHAIPFVEACKAGLDIYCEKPLAVTIWEGQQMVRAARRYNRVSQCGTQQHSGPHYHEAMQKLHDGAIGQITKVLCWNWSNQSRSGLGKAEYQNPPDHLDWDFWLGPLPKLDYFPQRVHGGFRFFWDTDGGWLTDWATHHFDIIHWALQQRAPKSVSCEGGKFVFTDCRETPDTQDAVYHYDGCLVQYSLRAGNASDPAHPHKVKGTWQGYGIEFYGKKGTLFINRNRYEIWPEDEAYSHGLAHQEVFAVDTTDEEQTYHEKQMDDNHVKDFLQNIKSRGRCVCDVEVCHWATSACHLGNIALRSGERIEWDTVNERIVQHKALNSWLRRDYRAPWKLVV